MREALSLVVDRQVPSKYFHQLRLNRVCKRLTTMTGMPKIDQLEKVAGHE
jgi:hypothetical protein